MICQAARLATEKREAFTRPPAALVSTGVSVKETKLSQKKSYYELLRDPRWQKRRLEIMSAAGFACAFCESTEKTLNVHHRIYRKGSKPWEYADHELLCLCEDCHEADHRWRSRLDEAITRLHPGLLEELVGFAEGCVACEAVFTDEEPPKPFSWNAISYGHAWGFLARLLVSCPPEDVEALLLDTGEITRPDVFALGTKRVTAAALRNPRGEDEGA